MQMAHKSTCQLLYGADQRNQPTFPMWSGPTRPVFSSQMQDGSMQGRPSTLSSLFFLHNNLNSFYFIVIAKFYL